MKLRLLIFSWNLLTRALSIACHGEQTVSTSPSGGVKISLCHGWCGAFKIEAGGYMSVGFGEHRLARVMDAYEQHLRVEGRFVEADEIYRILAATA